MSSLLVDDTPYIFGVGTSISCDVFLASNGTMLFSFLSLSQLEEFQR